MSSQRSTVFTILLLLLSLGLAILTDSFAVVQGHLPQAYVAVSRVLAGIAFFALVHFSLRFVNARLDTPEGLLLLVLLLFNPMLGPAATTSIGYATGTALSIAILALTVRDDHAPEEHLLAGIALTGILAGLALPLMPLVLLPALIAFGRIERKLLAVAFFVGAVAAWLIPVIAFTGTEEWMGNAGRDLAGYLAGLNDRGTGFPGLERKRLDFLSDLILGGFGGYRNGGVMSLVVLAGLALCFSRGAWWMFHRETDGLIIIVASMSVHIAAILIYLDGDGAGHVLPLIPLLLFPVWAGAVQLMRGGPAARIAAIMFLCVYAAAGIGIGR